MWYGPQKYVSNDLYNVNQEMLKLEGYLEDREARISLAKFLRIDFWYKTRTLSRGNTQRHDE